MMEGCFPLRCLRSAGLHEAGVRGKQDGWRGMEAGLLGEAGGPLGKEAGPLGGPFGYVGAECWFRQPPNPSLGSVGSQLCGVPDLWGHSV